MVQLFPSRPVTGLENRNSLMFKPLLEPGDVDFFNKLERLVMVIVDSDSDRPLNVKRVKLDNRTLDFHKPPPAAVKCFSSIPIKYIDEYFLFG